MSNTISDREWRKLRDRALAYEVKHGGTSSREATDRRKASDPKKAGSN